MAILVRTHAITTVQIYLPAPKVTHRNSKSLIYLTQVRALALPKIPLIENLVEGEIPPGSNILVEFDPTSQWFAVSIGIAAEELRRGVGISYNVASQPPEEIRLQLGKAGLDVKELETNENLRLWDWYTATLGQKSMEKLAIESLKAADLSIFFARIQMQTPVDDPGSRLLIHDDISVLDRFNDPKSWVEFELSRDFPDKKIRRLTQILGLLRGVHDDWVYRRLEASSDCVIDFKLDDSGDKVRNFIRVRLMRNLTFDSHWHAVKVGEKFALTLDE